MLFNVAHYGVLNYIQGLYALDIANQSFSEHALFTYCRLDTDTQFITKVKILTWYDGNHVNCHYI